MLLASGRLIYNGLMASSHLGLISMPLSMEIDKNFAKPVVVDLPFHI